MNGSTAAQSGVTASIAGMGVGYTNSNSGTSCTVTFSDTSAGQMGVAGGRVWGNLNCPALNENGGQQSVCEGNAEFKFEDCTGG